MKVMGDTCDYNFECLSRCCFENRCCHFLNCYQQCRTNSDCGEGGCCSEGYCTHDVVCDGNKVIGDVCDEHSECLTRYCDPVLKVCAVKPASEKLRWVGIVSISVSGLVVLLFLAYCCKVWVSSSQDSFFQQNDGSPRIGGPAENSGLGSQRMSEMMIRSGAINGNAEYD